MKRLIPMVASLALCGAGIAVLHAGNASADTRRRPKVVAMLTPHLPFSPAAAPAPDGGNPPPGRRPGPADVATRRKQICQDNYAHEVGQMAYLEARLELAAAQRPLFDRWKTVRLDIARRSLTDCSTKSLPAPAAAPPTPAEAMAREEESLKRRLSDLEAERPALSALYGSLNANQQQALSHPDNIPMGPHPMVRRRLGGGPGAMPPDGPLPGPGAPLP